MRLLRAELHKLYRPLLAWLAIGFVVLVCLATWEGARNAAAGYAKLRYAEAHATPAAAFGSAAIPDAAGSGGPPPRPPPAPGGRRPERRGGGGAAGQPPRRPPG